MSAELLNALKAFSAAQNMSQYGDSSGFVWPQQTIRKPGDHAYGYICEKHGLGYQAQCICCRDDFMRYSKEKDYVARNARDDALRAADQLANIAILKATGADHD